MTKIRDAFIESNRWWKEDYKIEYYERDLYKEISKYISLPQIIALTGLRRIGKTTLMQKVVLDFINNGFDVRNIIYFSFDDFRNIEIKELIKDYEEFMEKDFKNGKYLLLLDEIQKVANWEDQIKRVYDIYGKI